MEMDIISNLDMMWSVRCLGYTQMLWNFIWGTWASSNFGICGGFWNLSAVDTKEQL